MDFLSFFLSFSFSFLLYIAQSFKQVYKMLFHLISTTLLGLAASLPVELELTHESLALALRDAGAVMPLESRTSSGVTYTISQNFVVNGNGPPFAGPYSPDGVSFNYQNDGNFVVYDPYGNPVFTSNTGAHENICDNSSSQCYLAFLGNGNLAVYIGGSIAWQTGTAGKGYQVAFMGKAPYVIIYNKSNKAIWNSGGAAPPPGGPCARGTGVICP